MPMLADAHISSLGYLWENQLRYPVNTEGRTSAPEVHSSCSFLHFSILKLQPYGKLSTRQCTEKLLNGLLN